MAGVTQRAREFAGMEAEVVVFIEKIQMEESPSPHIL
jgi:hypothetical protein